jgi:hypothetical protein
MRALEPADIDLLASHRRNQRWIVLLGLLLVACGSAYVGWALMRFDPRATLAQHAGFDRPVSSLQTLYDPYKVVFQHLKPQTDVEQLLVAGLRGNMSFSVGIMMTMLRLFLGMVLVLDGLFMWTVAAERRRLLRIIERLGA